MLSGVSQQTAVSFTNRRTGCRGHGCCRGGATSAVIPVGEQSSTRWLCRMRQTRRSCAGSAAESSSSAAAIASSSYGVGFRSRSGAYRAGEGGRIETSLAGRRSMCAFVMRSQSQVVTLWNEDFETGTHPYSFSGSADAEGSSWLEDLLPTGGWNGTRGSESACPRAALWTVQAGSSKATRSSRAGGLLAIGLSSDSASGWMTPSGGTAIVHFRTR